MKHRDKKVITDTTKEVKEISAQAYNNSMQFASL